MEDASHRQSDVLILLVGGNPLPNAVSATWLAVPNKGTVLLLYSEASSEISRRLKKWIEKQGLQVERYKVEEASPTSITTKVTEQLKSVAEGLRVGLNYTGGTKAMAVHAYRAVEQWGQKRNTKPVFSYLDARTLRMIFSPDEDERYVGSEVRLEVEDLLELHGWKLKYPPPDNACLTQTSQELARVYLISDNLLLIWCSGGAGHAGSCGA